MADNIVGDFNTKEHRVVTPEMIKQKEVEQDTINSILEFPEQATIVYNLKISSVNDIFDSIERLTIEHTQDGISYISLETAEQFKKVTNIVFQNLSNIDMEDDKFRDLPANLDLFRTIIKTAEDVKKISNVADGMIFLGARVSYNSLLGILGQSGNGLSAIQNMFNDLVIKDSQRNPLERLPMNDVEKDITHLASIQSEFLRFFFGGLATRRISTIKFNLENGFSGQITKESIERTAKHAYDELLKLSSEGILPEGLVLDEDSNESRINTSILWTAIQKTLSELNTIVKKES